MPQIAWFRGALWDPTKVDLARVAGAPVTGVKDRLAKGELVRDTTKALYRYHQTFAQDGRSVTRKLLVTCIRLAPWSEGTIRPHEATNPRSRDAAIAGIAAEGAHTDPVFAGYRDAPREVDRLLRAAENDRPVADVTTADGTQHRVWRVSSAEVWGKLRPLFAPKKLHVLDGHARYEGMLAYQHQLGGDSLLPYSSANYGLGCLVNVEEPSLVVSARHRVVRGAIKRDDVLAAARPLFIVDKLAGAAKDLAKQRAALADMVAHQPGVVLTFASDPDAWKLTLSPDVSPVDEGIAVHRALQKYDPVVVELLLKKATPGAAATTELDPAAVLRAVEGGAEMGLLTRPITLEQVLHADELGAVVPFGSTAFGPRIPSLVIHVVEPDVDLV